MIRKFLLTIPIIFLFTSIYSQRVEIEGQFRGVWISTVKRLDYPSRSGLNSYELKREFIKILDSCKSVGINAVIFQIRPAADAFYASAYEPWSQWLTGKQGRAPYPYFDPLKFMIEQTHKRHMQFHAWINPFRAVATIGKADIVANHITKRKPQWFFNYGINKYFNPGIPAVRNYIATIISDIVRRYDIDAIHFDDYFYPYPIRDKEKKIINIPDSKTFRRYNQGFRNIKNWRRNNINLFIRQVHDSIKKIKPWVRFGVSPPGVWRNKGYDSDGSATLGLAAYDWLYADVLFWLKKHWIDYVAPQLYWSIENKRANYKILLNWWVKHSYGIDLYIGLNIQAINKHAGKKSWGNPNEIPEQIKLADSYHAVKGFILYRYSSLMKNPLGITDSLKNNYFADTNTIALIAQNNILSEDTEKIKYPNPSAPQNVEKYRLGKEISIVWDQNSYKEHIIYYNIYKFEKNYSGQIDSSKLFLRSYKDFFRFKRHRRIIIFGKKYSFFVTAVNANGKESKPSKAIRVKL